ncbi:hypothetical protein B0G38_001443 [Arthrobacter sp. VKM Ac-2550]|nr:hypothetical protein [Arthrobacter sp. VKM Ac-2550]
MAAQEVGGEGNKAAFGWAMTGVLFALLTVISFSRSDTWYMVLGSCVVAAAAAAMVACFIATSRAARI